MNKIEEMYYVYCEQKSKEEIREEWNDFEKMQNETKIKIEDETYYPFLDYVCNAEKKSFINGFKYAMQLVRECGL